MKIYKEKVHIIPKFTFNYQIGRSDAEKQCKWSL